MNKYWDAYWASKRPKINCSVCLDMGIVSGENENKRDMSVIPCPMKCNASNKYRKMVDNG